MKQLHTLGIIQSLNGMKKDIWIGLGVTSQLTIFRIMCLKQPPLRCKTLRLAYVFHKIGNSFCS